MDRIIDRSKENEVYEFEIREDSYIWNQFREGNRDAFNYIYQNNFNRLYYYCLQFSESGELIKDCIQDFFISIHRNHNNLGPTNSIQSYLFLSIKRKLFRYLKKEQRTTSIENIYKKIKTYEKEMSFEFNLIVEQEELFKHQLLQKAIGQLSKKEKKALYLFYFMELSYHDLAEHLGMSNIKSARNLVYKSLNNLRKIYDEIPSFN